MGDQGFQIHIRSNSSTADEWKRAMNASEFDLKAVLPLTEEQKEIAKRFEITEEEYARGELAAIYGKQRLQERAQRLGTLVQKMLSEIGHKSRLAAVLYEGAKFRWVFRIETPHGIRNLSVPRELADDVLDSELFEAVQQLKNHLKDNLVVETASGD